MFFDKKKREERRRKDELIRRNPQLMAGQDTYTFRRSRTLTGSVSSAVRGANESQAQLKSPRLKAHELRHHRRKVGIALLGVLALAGSTYWLLLQYVSHVTAISYSPSVARPPQSEKYTQTMQSYFRSRPFERFRFALDVKSFEKHLQRQHPEIAGVNGLSGKQIGQAMATIAIRQPVVGWKVGQQQYYVDGKGVSFRHNYFAPPGVTVRDLSGVDPSNGGAIASNRFLSFLGRVVALTEEMAVGQVTTVTIPSGLRTRTVEISLKGRAYPVRMHIDRDPAEQVEDMKRSIQYLRAKGINPKYVDVRIAGKAFYR